MKKLLIISIFITSLFSISTAHAYIAWSEESIRALCKSEIVNNPVSTQPVYITNSVISTDLEGRLLALEGRVSILDSLMQQISSLLTQLMGMLVKIINK